MTEIRTFTPDDLDAVVAINAECVPEVGEADGARLAHIAAQCELALVAVAGDDVVGFALMLGPGADYDSVNYEWFCNRYTHPLYVDRIAITQSARGQGLGQRFYQQGESAARAIRAEVLCAEVNLEPPNPVSMRFHEAFGFAAVAETKPRGTDDYRVAMVSKDLHQ